MDHHGADHTLTGGKHRPIFVGSESSVDETDDPTVRAGQDHPSRVEVGVGEDDFIELVAVKSLCGPPAELRLVPQPKNVRRV